MRREHSVPILECAMIGLCVLTQSCTTTTTSVRDRSPEEEHARFMAQRQANAKSMARSVEERLNGWVQPEENKTWVPVHFLKSDIQLQGKWKIRGGHDHSTLEFSPSNGVYATTFYTRGCKYEYTLQRTAAFSNGVIELDRPVDEYFPMTYRRLYAVTLHGTDYLLPAAAVTKFLEGAKKPQQSVAAWLMPRLYLYQRQMDGGSQPSPAGDVLKAAPQK